MTVENPTTLKNRFVYRYVHKSEDYSEFLPVKGKHFAASTAAAPLWDKNIAQPVWAGSNWIADWLAGRLGHWLSQLACTDRQIYLKYAYGGTVLCTMHTKPVGPPVLNTKLHKQGSNPDPHCVISTCLADILHGCKPVKTVYIAWQSNWWWMIAVFVKDNNVHPYRAILKWQTPDNRKTSQPTSDKGHSLSTLPTWSLYKEPITRYH